MRRMRIIIDFFFFIANSVTLRAAAGIA